ncbi:RNB domain-containing ribonuclease [Candidatus Gracilibacteria bacterium]|nr:RNB domain-containing ribonuclease [Candidatus Gracilibacteria bacterium]
MSSYLHAVGFSKEIVIPSHNELLSTVFPDEVKVQVEDILRHGITDNALHRKEVEGITIDGKNSMDLDDAIWVEKTQKGYCLFVHISDVIEYFDENTPIDREALKRTTSIYWQDHIIPMIDHRLSNDLLSLAEIPGRKNKTLTIQMDIDHEGYVVHEEIYESHFRNKRQYNYETFREDFMNPDAQYHDQLGLLYELSEKLRYQRSLAGGGFYLDDDRRLSLGKQSQYTSYNPLTRVAHDIIESSAVAANKSAGKIAPIYKRHDKRNDISYYSTESGGHTGLQIHDYTHFTSPIRRYADTVVHRVIKNTLRQNKSSYVKNDLDRLCSYMNEIRLKIEAERRNLRAQERSENFVIRTENRLGREIHTYDMKHYIRASEQNSYLNIPEYIIQKMSDCIVSEPPCNWGWLIPSALVLGQKQWIQVIYDRICDENIMAPVKLFSLLNKYKFYNEENGGKFHIEELGDKETQYGIKCFYGDTHICTFQEELDGEHYRFAAQRVNIQVVQKIFQYFLEK